jgi:hypothetical protein
MNAPTRLSPVQLPDGPITSHRTPDITAPLDFGLVSSGWADLKGQMLIPVYCEESDLPLLATAWTLIRMSAFVAPTRSARNASHPVSPLPTIGGRVGYGA